MGVIDTVKTLTYLPALLKLKKGMTPRAAEVQDSFGARVEANACLLYTSPSPRDGLLSRMPSSA